MFGEATQDASKRVKVWDEEMEGQGRMVDNPA